jgi:hypothetical protein
MNLLVKSLILSAVFVTARGLVENLDTSRAQDGSTESSHKRKKTASVKLRRMQDKTMVDSPWHFDALANTKMGTEYSDARIQHAAFAAVEAEDTTLTRSEIDQVALNGQEFEDANMGDVEISTVHKDTPINSNNDAMSATERELLAQLRRRPNFNYDINRSKKGSSEAFIQRIRGKVGKRVEMRGKVGKLKRKWGDHEDDWWGSGKSGKGGKNGKSRSDHYGKQFHVFCSMISYIDGQS